MTSSRKIAANQANAKASTGPKTALGKSKTSKNAHRHGLSLPVSVDALRAEQVNKLAHEMVRKTADQEILDLARGIAEAEVDLVRVRQARHELFAKGYQTGEFDVRTIGFASKLSRLTKQLMLIDRYEQRALSRRKFAIRKLDAATRN